MTDAEWIPVGLSPFAGEPRRGHVLVILAGVLGFSCGYLGSALVFFDGLATFAPGARRVPALLAGAFGSMGCWGAFAIAFVRGRGGPVLDALVYPLPIASLLPIAVRWSAFSPDVGGIAERIGFVLFPTDVIASAVALTVPGMVFFASLLAVWAARLDEDQRRAWQRKRLTQEFSRAFVEDTER